MTDSVPGRTLGIVGGGQLGRMLGEAALPLGVETIVVDPTPDCPAVPPGAEQIVGDFDDTTAIEELAEKADVLTLEIELADPEILASVGKTTGTPIHPVPKDLRVTRDKLEEKQVLAGAGISVADFRSVESPADLEIAFEELGKPLMLKARRGGYDGRGNALLHSVEAARDSFGDLSGLIAEELIDFDRELSLMGVRGQTGADTYPVAETVHEDEILRETLVPAQTDDQVLEQAEAVALDVLEMFEGRGVFGIELFEVDGEVLVNEIAPRPHNSGHYTIEGTVTSQFENHVRAVLGLPLGSTELREPTAMANLLGDGNEARKGSVSGVEDVLSMPGVHFHWYGKEEIRPLRKMGHLTASGPDLPENRTVVTDALERLHFDTEVN